MKDFTFYSRPLNNGPFGKTYSSTVIKNEPMLFNCTFNYGLRHGGPITKSFLHAIMNLPFFKDGEWRNTILDTRVHMLKKGWFPCIPGYHHDDVPRTRVDGQPNYRDDNNHADHIMGLVNGDICPTQFAVGPIHLDEPPIGKTIYEAWNKKIKSLIDQGKLKVIAAPSNILINFNNQTFHTGIPAIADGWRWFGRLTRGSTRKPTNEIRRQVQVYLSDVEAGW